MDTKRNHVAQSSSIMNRILILLLLILWRLSSGCVSATPMMIRAADDASYPPQIMLNEKGQPDGLEADLIRALEREIGIRVEWSLGSWADALHKIRSGEADIIPGMNITEERKMEFLFTRPYFLDRVVLFVPVDSFHIIGPDDLKNRRVGVQRGEVAEQLLKQKMPELHFYEFDSQRQLLVALAERKIDAAAANYYSGKYWLRQIELEKLIKTNGETVFENPFAIAVRRDKPELRELLDQGIFRLEQSGELQRIKNKWLGEPRAIWGLSRKELTRYLVGGIATTLLLLLLGLLMIRWLHQRIDQATATIAGQNLELQAAYQQLTAQNEALIAQGEELIHSETRAKALLQAVPDLIIRMNRAGIFQEVMIPSGTAVYSLHQMRIGQSIRDSVSDELAEEFLRQIAQTLEEQKPRHLEYQLFLETGLAYRESRFVPLGADEVMILIRDMTERRTTEKELYFAHQKLQEQHELLQTHAEELAALYARLSVSEAALRQRLSELETHRELLAASEERFRLAVEAANDVIFDWDLASGKVSWSNRWEERLGFSFSDPATTIQDFDRVVHPEDQNNRYRALDEHLNHKTDYYSSQYRLRDKDGNYFWILSRGKALLNEQNQPLRIVGALTDITEIKKNQEKILHLAYCDTLTGLANRARFLEELDAELQETSAGKCYGAVLFVNVDNFKAINDSFGHSCGDELLIDVSRRIQELVGAPHLLARLGGDEFVVLLKNENQVKEFADRLLMRFEEPFTQCGQKFLLTLSAGIARYPENGMTVGDLMRCADTAMHAAKRSGKNSWRYYDSLMHDLTLRKLRLEHSLRFALQNDEFQLHYQPIVESISAKVCGLEVLLRWNSPEYGTVPPVEFIPLAEENGTIVTIGEWVLDSASRFAQKHLDDSRKELFLSVNLSARQLVREDFSNRVRMILQETGFPAQRLQLEITETLMMENVVASGRSLSELRQQGIRIALDDFGTGYSSLTYLKRLPIQVVKIDKSFVDDVSVGKVSGAILETIIRLAHEMGLNVVAEGVETELQWRILVDRNCDMIQGYRVSRPLPEEQIIQWIRENEQDRK